MKVAKQSRIFGYGFRWKLRPFLYKGTNDLSGASIFAVSALRRFPHSQTLLAFLRSRRWGCARFVVELCWNRSELARVGKKTELTIQIKWPRKSALEERTQLHRC